jgi:hypothetical protein
VSSGADAGDAGGARPLLHLWHSLVGRGLLGPLTLLAGIAIAWADTRPTWDDAGITAGALFLVAGLAAAGGVRLWVAATVTVLPLMIAEVRGGSAMLLIPPAVALAGACGGWLLRHIGARRQTRAQ